MSDPIRQHTVPKCYLKNFALKRKKAWVVDVYDILEKKFFLASIENICVQSDYYTFPKLAPRRQKILESFYDEKIETHYPNIYKLLIDPEVGRLESLDRLKALVFVYSQYTRTSKLGSAFNQGWSRMLEHCYSMIDPSSEDQKIYNEDGSVFIDFSGKTLPQVLKETTQDNKETVNRKNFDNFLELNRRRLKDILAIYKFGEKHSLITSDNPVESSKFMFDPESQFEVALDDKHLLLLLPGDALPAFDNKELNRSDMDGNLGELISFMYNCRQIEQAERYIIGSRENLEKVLEDYNNQEAILKRLNVHIPKK